MRIQTLTILCVTIFFLAIAAFTAKACSGEKLIGPCNTSECKSLRSPCSLVRRTASVTREQRLHGDRRPAKGERSKGPALAVPSPGGETRALTLPPALPHYVLPQDEEEKGPVHHPVLRKLCPPGQIWCDGVGF
jgi:hypothetical protein